MIRADRIDILVDLVMHMAGDRPLLFARKPAPVQVTWLAYPGTTGLAAIDYRLTDPYLDPPGTGQGCYTEQSVALPETFWCYDPLTDEPAVNDLPALSVGRVTFGCLNNFAKVNRPVLELWARLLLAVEGSRLVLLANPGEHRVAQRTVLAEHGVAGDRVVFFVRNSRQQYLLRYHHCDLCLDTFPANGHTTTLDTLWMGVPVVTLPGDSDRAGSAEHPVQRRSAGVGG